MPTFMDKIREAKNRRNMTASELSRASGVPLGTLNKLLTGVIEEPKLSTAVALCHALTLSLAVIMDEDTVWAAADDEKKLLTDYRGTDEYGRAMVARVAEMECSRAADRRAEEEDRALHTPDEAEAEAVITLPLYLLPVSAGPEEATAIGNLMMQAITLGEVANVGEARQIIADSFPLKHYVPTADRAAWDEAYQKFCTLN